MRLSHDRGALESLPLRLIIVAIVASLSVVPAGEALENFRNKDFAARAELQLESIVSAAQLLMIEGPGGVRTLHVDFRNLGSVKFDRLVIGDEKGGPNMTSIILRLASGASLVRLAQEPEVWMRGQSGGSLVVSSPATDIRLSAQLSNRTAFVLAELA